MSEKSNLNITQLLSKGFSFQQAGNHAEAKLYYEQAIKISPNSAEALGLLGGAYIQLKDFSKAAHYLEIASKINPSDVVIFYNLGIAKRRIGLLEDAIKNFGSALNINPDFAECYNSRANAYQELKDFSGAKLDYQKAIEINPEYLDAKINLGKLLVIQGLFNDSLIILQTILEKYPEHAQAHYYLGLCYHELGKSREALSHYNKACSFGMSNAELFYNRGNLFKDIAKASEAIIDYQKAININPNFAAAFNNQGMCLHETGRHEAALQKYNQAIALDPNYAEAYSNRGALFKAMNLLNEALADFDKAILINQRFAEALSNKGLIHKEMGQFDSAFKSYEETIRHDGKNATAEWNKGVLNLLLGNFEEGWRGYEYRWYCPLLGTYKTRRTFAAPQWAGNEPLFNKTILLHAEQGLGDTIQFCRYAKKVKALGAKVILEVQTSLYSLLSTLDDGLAIIKKGDDIPAFDYHCPLMSLPLAFKTTLDAIPCEAKYLASTQLKSFEWTNLLGKKDKPRVGIVWSGSETHNNDKNRSIPFSVFSELICDGIEWICLQKEIKQSDQASLKSFPQVRVFTEQLHDFSDTAALCEQLDLIISVDTSVAHLSAAMGIPTWILLPKIPDWRWMLDSAHTPWYPSATLFRQQIASEWNEPFKEVIRKLNEEIARV